MILAPAATSLAQPIVIAHRGASADRPEHTLAAYKLAIEQGADFIEPDLVATKDGELVARHENEIGSTTDVADRPEFADRKRTKAIDGQQVTGWFTEDFTLAELKTLRARERIPQLRPANTAFDGSDTVPTLQEIIDLARSEERRTGRRIGLYPETKHPTYFAALELTLEERLVGVLHQNGYSRRGDAVFIQSFEVGNLKRLRGMTDLPLIQLIGDRGAPYDQKASGTNLTYAAMLTPEGLRAVAGYADGIGPYKDHVIPRQANGKLGAPSTLLQDAHKVGLKVHPWTFRPENYFLPTDMRRGESPAQRGDGAAEIRAFIAAGVDGFFTDAPTIGIEAVRGLSGARSSR